MSSLVKPPTPTYVRTPREIAKALGIRLLKQPAKREKQLAQIIAWTKQLDFPKKQNGKGWLVEQVLKFKSEIRKAETGQPGKHSTLNIQRSTSNPSELPAQDKPADGNDLFNLTTEEIGVANKERLHRNLLIHLGKMPSPTGQRLLAREMQELVDCGLLPRTTLIEPAEGGTTNGNGNGNGSAHDGQPGNGGPCGTPPNHNGEVRGLTHMAEILSAHYAALNLRVTKNDVMWWDKGERLPAGVPKPPQRDPGRAGWNRPRDWFIWYHEYFARPAQASVGKGQALLWNKGELQNTFDKLSLENGIEREKLEKERIAKERGDLVSVTWLADMLADIGRPIAVRYDKLIEDAGGLRKIVMETAAELGVGEDVRVKLDETILSRFVAANDLLKSEFAMMTNGVSEKLKR